jgi:hypothetical protein
MRGDRTGRRQRTTARVVTLALTCLLLTVLLGACGGGGSEADPTVLSAGQLDIKLPAGFKVVNGKVERPAQAASGKDAGPSSAPGASTETTIVATKQDPTTAMFTAFSKFRVCLDDLGTKFVGAPDASNPDSPTNDPSYVKNLSTCAARSGIVQALQASQAAQANQTPAQIKQANKGYLAWRSCMIDRGWKIPKPVPDAQGRLFSIGGASGSGGSGGSGGSSATGGIVAPPGKDLLTSKDLEECATKAQKIAGG